MAEPDLKASFRGRIEKPSAATGSKPKTEKQKPPASKAGTQKTPPPASTAIAPSSDQPLTAENGEPAICSPSEK